MPVSHQGSMVFPESREEVFQACLKAISECGFHMRGSNQETGHIWARSGMSLRSWGERIEITIGNDSRIDVKSSCYGIQIIDYGKNKANVNQLFAALEPLLPAASQR